MYSEDREKKYYIRFASPVNEQDVLFLTATVGEKVKVKRRGESEVFFVNSLDEHGVHITLCVKRGSWKQQQQQGQQQQGQQQQATTRSAICNAEGVDVFAEFFTTDFKYKVLSTALIDCWTALAPKWFIDPTDRENGIPLVRRRLPILFLKSSFLYFRLWMRLWLPSSEGPA